MVLGRRLLRSYRSCRSTLDVLSALTGSDLRRVAPTRAGPAGLIFNIPGGLQETASQLSETFRSGQFYVRVRPTGGLPVGLHAHCKATHATWVKSLPMRTHAAHHMTNRNRSYKSCLQISVQYNHHQCSNTNTPHRTPYKRAVVLYLRQI